MGVVRIPEGHEPTINVNLQAEASTLEAVAQVLEQDRSKYVDLAKRRLFHYGVEEATLAPEGAVQEAHLRICRRIQRGRVPPVTSQEDWDGRLTRMIRRVTSEKGRWQRARKRSAPERDHNELALLEAPDPHAGRTDEDVGARLHVESLLARLGRKDQQLRLIAVMRIDGHTHEEIAAHLGLAVKTVEWKLRQIRSLLEPHLRAGR
jgi:DNA-directed RNA polymerase specialized sigma24 family protein